MATIHVKQFDLNRCGLALTPDGTDLLRIEASPTRADTPDALESGLAERDPAPSWGPDRLTERGKGWLDQSFGLEKETTRLRFRAGKCFAMARDHFKVDKEWGAFLRKSGVNPTRAWESIKIFEHFGREEEAAKHRITKALVLAGATKPRKPTRLGEPPVVADRSGPPSQFDGPEPPPPESPDSIRFILVKIANRLGLIRENLSMVAPDDIPLREVELSLRYLSDLMEHAHGTQPVRAR